MSQTDPAQGQTEAAFEAFFRAHEASMYGLALQICGDPRLAAEVVAEGFARVWPRAKAGGAADLAAVRRTIVREINTRLRRTRGQAPPAPGSPGDDPIRRALQALPLRRRTLVVLRYQADLSPVDAAEATGLSLSTVKAESKKGVRQLRRALALPDESRPRAAPPSPPPEAGHDVSWITQPEAVGDAESWVEIDDAPPVVEGQPGPPAAAMAEEPATPELGSDVPAPEPAAVIVPEPPVEARAEPGLPAAEADPSPAPPEPEASAPEPEASAPEPDPEPAPDLPAADARAAEESAADKVAADKPAAGLLPGTASEPETDFQPGPEAAGSSAVAELDAAPDAVGDEAPAHVEASEPEP
ncbi:MAG TPA: sigma factor-like helix-turn-helix DNA-binding protein [Actinomycetota bacterium]|nr:sigma factor-like helix-turn-helix DNA-binding protein [Actinomycetota bacterium]